MYNLQKLALDYTLGLIHIDRLRKEVDFFNMGNDTITASIVHTDYQTIVVFK